MVDGEFDLVLYGGVFGLVGVLDVVFVDVVFEEDFVGGIGDVDGVFVGGDEGFVV